MDALPPWYKAPVEMRPGHPVVRRALEVMEQLYEQEQREDANWDPEAIAKLGEAVADLRWIVGQDVNGPAYPLHVLIERCRDRGWRMVLPTEMKAEMTAHSRVRFDNTEAKLSASGLYPVLCGGLVVHDPFWAWPRHASGPRPAQVRSCIAQIRHGLTQFFLPWDCDRALAPPLPKRLLHPLETLRGRLRLLPSLAAFAKRTGFPYATLHRLRSDEPHATASVPLVHALAVHLGYGIRWVPGKPAGVSA